MGPTQVADIAHLPNVVIKPGRTVKFFLCGNGHIEPWRGEVDAHDMPHRRCNTCSTNMELTARRIRKDGTLSVTTRKKGPKVKVEAKTPSEKTMLARFVRCLRHPYLEYRVEYARPDMIRVTRKGDAPKQVNGRVYSRFVEVTVDTVAKKAQVDLYGVSGWFEEFRIAAKQCKLVPVAKFYPPLSRPAERKSRSG